ncbi:hypothetical protein PENTCL1PPCAC_27453 [Pristionchus entomophagus]|uniref:Fatty acid hydroxylase domain-containing protein n=1 Tax=Pristionchus entomophagus TaxID=358040 RepID=A0AAV5UFX7_9BILA|nr:hypothetical protein PENTCL1PPCAC_27453 [Pristionchus entomophagus]
MISALLYPPRNYTPAEMAYEADARLLQGLWDKIHKGNEYWITSSLFPPFYALSIDWAFVFVFTFIDLFLCNFSIFKDNKIQKDRKVTWSLIKKSIYLQFWNCTLWIFPLAAAQWCWVPALELPPLAPTVFEMVSQIAIYFFLFDMTYFWFHYIHHKNKTLYRWCHSVHHMYSSPFAAAAQHLHPFELFFVGGFITVIPWIFPTHPLTYWVWFLIAQLVSYEVHMGYDFPFALHRFFKFYSGAPAHDMHHLRPLTCFQPWLNYMDRLMGYHITYDDLKKMADEKNKRYGLYAKEDEEGLDKIN